MKSCPLVSVILPCRNEARHIEAALASILQQRCPPGGLEIIVADGMSSDGTRELVIGLSKSDERVRLVDNPSQFTPHGLNAAISAARGEIIVRIDGHSEYAPDYLQSCVEALERTNADNVGGAWIARGRSYLSRAIAAAFQSPFAIGGARGHRANYEGPVDTVYLGCWRKSVFARFGNFDEELVRNQDDEHNLRINRSGGLVWQSTRIRSWYIPRQSLGALFRQYAQYGYWKVRVIQKHRIPASLRHIIPAAFVATLLAGALLACLFTLAGKLTFGLLCLYVGCTCIATVITAAQSEWQLAPVLPAVFWSYHFGYGIGFLHGILDFALLRRGPRPAATVVTRVN